MDTLKRDALLVKAASLLTSESAFNVKHELLTPNRSIDDKHDLWSVSMTTAGKNALGSI
jgi:hypothetical protein